MKRLIFDLRGNPGGFLDQAIRIANEFLPADKLIVYTEDRRHNRTDEMSDGNGTIQELPLAVLIDEFSASSSEILAGALQDNDRGTILSLIHIYKLRTPVKFDNQILIILERIILNGRKHTLIRSQHKSFRLIRIVGGSGSIRPHHFGFRRGKFDTCLLYTSYSGKSGAAFAARFASPIRSKQIEHGNIQSRRRPPAAR